MATYLGPSGEVDATQLAERVEYASGYVGEQGEWFVRGSDGVNHVMEADFFAATYRQKYPRLADAPETPRVDETPECV